jgi:hypothetical protein
MSASDIFEPEARPIPPRYWWLKRIGAGAGVLVLALVAVRLWWGHVAERRLRAKIAEYHAAGLPILCEDFGRESVPDDENAASLLAQAAALVGTPPDLNEVVRALRNRTVSPEDMRRFLTDNERVLRLVQEAGTRPRADWHLRITSPMFNTLLPYLRGQRGLAATVDATALYQHVLGDDKAALETVRDSLAISRYVNGRMAVLISHLVSISIRALGTTTLEEITPDLRVTRNADLETRAADLERRAATRAQVQALIRELLDESPLGMSLAEAMHGEGVEELDTVRAMWEGRLNLLFPGGRAFPKVAFDWGMRALLTPAWKLDALRMLETCDALGRAGAAPTWPAARQQMPAQATPASTPGQLSELLSSILMPSLEGAISVHFRQRAQQRMVAVALAIRLYELDHGQRPADLAELVPDYLAAIPGDPFDPNEQPIRYLPNASSPLLYSVGSNGLDDKGFVAFHSGGGIDFNAGDQPFFLNGDRPLPPPAVQTTSSPAAGPTSTQAVIRDEQVERAERNEGE